MRVCERFFELGFAIRRGRRQDESCSAKSSRGTRRRIPSTVPARSPDWSNSNQTILARRYYVAPLRLSSSRNMPDANLVSLIARNINPPAISPDAMLGIQALDRPAAIDITTRGAETASPRPEYLGVIRNRSSCFPEGYSSVAIRSWLPPSSPPLTSRSQES